jgi:PIN domain nuclease of toxin-antitoxin system
VTRLLLDTHALIWAVDAPARLSPAAAAALRNPAHRLLVSAGTAWEMAIKVGTGKLTLSGPYRAWITQALADLGAHLLPITIDHADVQGGLPFHHRDPFDRPLVAQSVVVAVPVVSGDTQLDAYGITRVW